VQDLNYEYDRVGNVLQMDNRLPPPQTELKGGPSRQTYRYDPYYRLQSATGSAPQAPNRQRDYTYAMTYDLHGNIQSKIQRDTTSQVTSSGAIQIEEGGNMIIALTMWTREDCLRHHSSRNYRQFVAGTQHLLAGSFVLKIFKEGR